MKMYLSALVGATLVVSSCSKSESEQKINASEVTVPTQAAATYPLDTCVVSGEKLGSMGDSIVYQHEGTEVRFCCKSCIKKFKKDPAKYLVKLKK